MTEARRMIIGRLNVFIFEAQNMRGFLDEMSVTVENKGQGEMWIKLVWGNKGQACCSTPTYPCCATWGPKYVIHCYYLGCFVLKVFKHLQK